MNNVTVTYSNGDSLSVEGLASFQITSSNKNYLLYTLNEYAENNLIKVYAACVDSTDNAISEEEWDQLKKLMSKITHNDQLDELKFSTFENKTYSLGEAHPKKIGLKETQVEAIKNYQNSRVVESIRNDNTAVIGDSSNQPVSETKSPDDRKSFFDNDLIQTEDKTEEKFETGPNIFDSPLKPEFENYSNPEPEKQEQEEKQEESTTVATPEEPQFIETPVVGTSVTEEQTAETQTTESQDLGTQAFGAPVLETQISETTEAETANVVGTNEPAFMPEVEAQQIQEQITSMQQEVKELNEKVNEGSVNMLPNEVQQIKDALNEANESLSKAQVVVSESLSKAQVAVDNAKTLVENINVQSAEAQATVTETPVAAASMEAPVQAQVNEQPAMVPQEAVQAVSTDTYAQAVPVTNVGQPIESYQATVMNSEPIPISMVGGVEAAQPAMVPQEATQAVSQEAAAVNSIGTEAQASTFVEPGTDASLQAPNINVIPIPGAEAQNAVPAAAAPAADNIPLFGTPDTQYVEPNYNEVPPVMDLGAQPVEAAAQPVEAAHPVYGPASLDPGVQQEATGGVQRTLAA